MEVVQIEAIGREKPVPCPIGCHTRLEMNLKVESTTKGRSKFIKRQVRPDDKMALMDSLRQAPGVC